MPLSVRRSRLPPSLWHRPTADLPPTEQLKDIIQDLYQIMVQVSTYDSMGRASKDVLSNEV